VGVWPRGAKIPGQGPVGATIAAVSSTGGTVTITDGAILSLTDYVLYAHVGNSHNYCDVRSTLDIFDAGKFILTGDISQGSPTVSNVSVSLGQALAGSRISGSGIPAGTTIANVVDATTLTLSANATATGTSVSMNGEGAYTWQARVRRRRLALGTS
jgi:hypothetical protein